METLHTTVAILGSGFSGLGAAIKLKESGQNDFIILEREADLGGTWRDNSYPGVACDVPAHLYSYSFEPNPEWSRHYAGGGEIQAYILRCAEKYQLRPNIKFGVNVDKLQFDEATRRWIISSGDNVQIHARFVIAGMGPLNKASFPAIAGIDTFQGELLHSAHWPKDFDWSGKTIAVVGTGASSIQIVPAIADRAKKLTVLQRTAPWILPKPDKVVPDWQKKLFRTFPFVQRLFRLWIYIAIELYGPFVYLKGEFFKKKAETFALGYLKRKIADPDLREKCTPNYRIGCKRILFSSDWYDALNRSNVDLETTAIDKIEAKSILLKGGKRIECDVIICATGFSAPTAGAPFPIVGLGGLSLDSLWKDGAFAYKGMAVTGFPNLFFALGPNTGPGHTSVLVYVETQIRYIIRAIKSVSKKERAYLNLKEDRLRSYNAWISERMKKMIWTNGACHSWYLTKTGKNTSLYPGPSTEYCIRARRFKQSDYHVDQG